MRLTVRGPPAGAGRPQVVASLCDRLETVPAGLLRLGSVRAVPPTGAVTDDLSGPIEGRARLRPPYLPIVVVAVLAAAIVGAGYFGPHPAAHPTSGPSTSALADRPAAPPSVTPSATPTRGPDALAGLTLANPGPGQIRETWLPGQVTSQSMAVVGMSLFFIVGGDRIESTAVGGDGSRQTLAQVPACEGINQLAAAGHELAYVVTSPGGPTSQVQDCVGAGRITWSVWLLDLAGGSPRQVATGARAPSSIDVAEFPIHLAVTESAYAFDRPAASAAAGPGETVEVHSLDGRLLWSSHTQMSVTQVMLGGGTLAILTVASPPAAGVVDLCISDAAHPQPTPVEQPARSASLSPDGLLLTWDVAYQGPWDATFQGPFPGPNSPMAVAVETLGSGVAQPLATLTDRSAPAPLRPAISSTDRGPLVTWFATGSDGAIHPAVRYASGGNGAYLPSLQEPVWMSVEGGTLFWVAEGGGGWSKAAFAVDLASLALR